MKPLEATRLLLRQRWHRLRRAEALRSLRMHRRNGSLYAAHGCESAARHWSRRLCKDQSLHQALTWITRPFLHTFYGQA